MAEMDTLERLVTGLSQDERQKMFEKLQSLASFSAESLYPAPPEEDAKQVLPVEKQYAALPWYYRLFYFILSIFKNRAPAQIFLDARVGRLGRRIDVEYPGFYDYRQGLLLADFSRLLATLKGDARFFFDALDISVNRNRGGVYSFLGSLEMPEIHRALETELEPQNVREKNPVLPDTELRQAALRVMEDIFARITEVQRVAMYRNARSLYCLKELASYLYDRVLIVFSPQEGAPVCPVKVVRELLESLNNILFSLKEPPSLALLESLFIFILQARAVEPGFDADRELRRLLNRAEGALVNIRNFNRRLPLTLILRCGNRDMAYTPRQITGGEDWYTVYRDYWRRYITLRFADYVHGRRYSELQDLYKRFFPDMEMVGLVNAAPPGALEGAPGGAPGGAAEGGPGGGAREGGDGFPLGGALSLSFLLSFYQLVFAPEIAPLLTPLVTEGGFIAREDQAVFAGTCSDLAGLGGDIQKLDEKIGPEGIYGERYAQTRQDMSSLPVKRRKMQLLLEDADEEGFRIIERTRMGIGSLVGVIAGITKKNSGGRSDSPSALLQVEVRIPDFLEKLHKAGERLQEALRILDHIAILEAESAIK
ncbi:MAG: DUF5312 domain-containing protein [Treponema sp.]|jgi:hypothetical protein|nr:DUF5312 domain-containing protein [Treponema sp.]